MSLILEALRKSEAERRRGSTPDVAMELPPVPIPRTPATRPWLLPAIAFAAVALLAGWWWSQRAAARADDTRPVAVAPLAEPRIEAPAPPVVVARPAPPPVTPAAPAAASIEVAPPVAAPAAPPVRPLPSPPPPPPPPPARVERADVADIDSTAMPPVKLSMHMWDEAPGKRFVILNGQRMGEGDRNGEVTVVAIERDGVVVERNGQRARVPLP